MTYFADLTPYSFIGRAKGELNVGWLDGKYPFQNGPVHEEVLEVIFELCKVPVNLTRGIHFCNLCSERRFNVHERNGDRIALGGAEIRVKGKSERVYVSPNLIYHYIKDHRYQPPQEFIDAVLDLALRVSTDVWRFFNGMNTGEHLTDLQTAILRAFPDVAFDGQITPHDGEWPDEVTEETALYDGQVIYGDEMLLYQGLKGHKWSDIPREFIEGMVIDFVLLTSEALAAFIAAWLMRSLENFAGKNDVRGDFISMLSPDREESKKLTIDLLRAFNPEQLAVLRLFFVESFKSESSQYVREDALNAVKFLDGLSTVRR